MYTQTLLHVNRALKFSCPSETIINHIDFFLPGFIRLCNTRDTFIDINGTRSSANVGIERVAGCKLRLIIH